MSTVRVSPKYQIVIPKPVREAMGIKPGQELSLIRVGRTVQIMPVRSLKELTGVLKGVRTERLREKKDRDL
jgi:AbrB family looped-hinge helix DNA binding protein